MIRRVAVLGGLFALEACSDGSAQRIVVDRQAISEVRAEELETDAVEEVPPTDLATLARPSPLDGLVAVQPSDLMTATARSSPSLVFGPGTSEAERELRAPGRVMLREYPEGTDVPFEWVEGSEGYGSVTRQLLMVPARPLESRWYAIEVRAEQAISGALRSDSVQVSRFRPDSYPVFQGIAIAIRDGEHLVEARFSERVSSEIAAADWRIEDDDGALPCSVVGPEPGREEARSTWTCERAIEGHVRIDFGGVLTTIHGDRLRDLRGETLTRVEVGDTVLVESEGVTILR